MFSINSSKKILVWSINLFSYSAQSLQKDKIENFEETIGIAKETVQHFNYFRKKTNENFER